MKRQRSIRGIATGLAGLLLLGAISGCGSTGTGLSSAPGGGKWVDSDVVGYVEADSEIRLQDDFAAAVNQEWIAAHTPESAYEELSNAGNTSQLVETRYREILADESVTGANADVLRVLEDLILNWDERNKQGIEPLRGLIEEIERIDSIDDFTQYQASVDRNPFGIGLLMPGAMDVRTQYVDQSMLVLITPSYLLESAEQYTGLGAAGLDLKERKEEMISYFLGRLGYADADIAGILAGNYRIETFVARNIHTYNAQETFQNVESDRDRLTSFLAGYPLFEILDGRGFGGCNSFRTDYMYLAVLHSIYNESHLEDLKSFAIVHSILSTSVFFDRESIDKVNELSVPRNDKYATVPEVEDNALFAALLRKSGYMPAMDALYLAKYFGDGERIALYNDIMDDLIDAYHQMINEVDWMSDVTKAEAQEKLNNMAVHVITPDNTADYASVAIRSYDEGGTLLDAIIEGEKLMNAHMVERAADPVHDRFFWDIYDVSKSTTTVNSYYSPQENAFYILAGWAAIADYIYGDTASYEQILGCVATTMGHEISHGFDASGSHCDKYGRSYDDEGNQIDWMETDDRSRLDERTGRLASYYSLVRPMPGKSKVSGERVKNEAMADMAGIKANLYLAKKTPDFDYDAFFRAYAALWATQRSETYEERYLGGDVHPLAYLRVNIGLQQFDEFLETYHIGPGDGMYLDPERRVAVW